MNVSERHARKRGQLLAAEGEPEVIGVERGGTSHVLHLIPNSVDTFDEWVWVACTARGTVRPMQADTGCALDRRRSIF